MMLQTFMLSLLFKSTTDIDEDFIPFIAGSCIEFPVIPRRESLYKTIQENVGSWWT